MTTVALIGRGAVRTFGSTSGGYTTANQPHRLADGAMLAITSAFIRDRTGRDYRDAIGPDEQTRNPQAAALRWLESQRGCED